MEREKITPDHQCQCQRKFVWRICPEEP